MEKGMDNKLYKHMWLADRWKDYEVIDCSCGEKLERWSKYSSPLPETRHVAY